MRFLSVCGLLALKTLFLCTFCHTVGFGVGDSGRARPSVDVSPAATFMLNGASYLQRLDFHRAADRSKMRSMAGCLPNTKRFRHGRPDRGRC